MPSSVVGVFELVRPLNVLMIMVGVVLGAMLSGHAEAVAALPWEKMLAAILSAGFLGAAGNSLNDFYDIDIDRINRPERPLPSGRLQPGTARWIGLGGFGIGLMLSATLSLVHFALALSTCLLLFFYNKHLKKTALTGNVVVALLLALLIVFGGLLVEPTLPVLAGAFFAFGTTLVRELVKDLEDLSGDGALDARTAPLAWGIRPTVHLATFLLALVLLLTPLPYLLGILPGLYLVAVLICDTFLLLALWMLLQPAPEKAAGICSRHLKTSMAFGMLALMLGSWF